MRKIKIFDYDQMNLTWNIDVFYKDQYITTFSRKELDKFDGMFAVSIRVLRQKYNIECDSSDCDAKYPFEVNCHLYNAEKLTSLRALLIKQYDPYLDTLVVATERYENEHELPILKSSASSVEEFEEYMKYLNNDENVLKLRLKELNVEKRIDLRFIKNIDLIYDEYIENLNRRKKRVPELYEDSNSYANQSYNFSLEFKKKYDEMMKSFAKLHAELLMKEEY